MKEQNLTRVWWIDEEDKILGGMYPGNILDELVATHSVTAYLNLQERDEANYTGVPFPDYLPLAAQLAHEAVESQRIEIPDVDIPDDPADMDEAIHFLLRMREQRRVTYVHCWGGHGRTGLVAACYLKCIKGYTVEEAFGMIAQARAHSPYLSYMASPQTLMQRAFAEAYEYMEPVDAVA